jgi:uncharacterized membrane protein YkvA (DUF1232 family)
VVRGLLVALAVAIVIWLLAILVPLLSGRRSSAREQVGLVPNLLLLFRDLVRDPRVPRGSKILLGLAVVWIASPIDLTPEFVPITGPQDDAIVAALVLRQVLRPTDRAVLLEHWRGDPATLGALVGRSRDGG